MNVPDKAAVIKWTPEQQDAVNTVQSLRALKVLRSNTFPLAAAVGVPTSIPLTLTAVASNSSELDA